jgi:hypothetical protein
LDRTQRRPDGKTAFFELTPACGVLSALPLAWLGFEGSRARRETEKAHGTSLIQMNSAMYFGLEAILPKLL